MPNPEPAVVEIEISRERLAELWNEDLAREYQAIIGYVVYSQVLQHNGRIAGAIASRACFAHFSFLGYAL